jgi:DNA-binding MurR/RpiR family transcriptional regulator
VRSVLITDTLALALKRRYTVALSAPRGEVDKQPTATVPLAILEALQLGISTYDRSRSLAAMATRDELRQRLR